MILASLAGLVALLGAIGTLTDFPEKVDPLIHTEAEAKEEHHQIYMASEQAQQTQAGFNAYTLRLLLEQEIEILKLKIETEEDPDEKKLLEAQLASKLAFIHKLELEEREQMMKGRGES